jgi:hypothetical protein
MNMLDAAKLVPGEQLPGEIHAPDIAYWRKHHDLHAWMAELALRKGYASNWASFNCVPLPLTLEEIEQLDAHAAQERRTNRDGTFHSYAVQDQEFLDKARADISNGRVIVYDSWW